MLIFIGIYLHTVCFQVLDKNTMINEISKEQTLRLFMKFFFINDLVNVYTKWVSRNSILGRTKELIHLVLIPVCMFIFNIYTIFSFEIETYRKSFKFSAILLCLSYLKKTTLILKRKSYFSACFWLVDPIFIINLILISLTNPQEIGRAHV